MIAARSSGPAVLPALQLVQSSRAAQRLAAALLVLMGLTICGMAFLPWQQSARGTGRIVAFVPQERQQTVTSPVKGVVERLAEGLVEGARVKQGDFILEIEPGAEDLEEQLQAQMRDLQTKLGTANTKAEVYTQNMKDYSSARDFAVGAADEMVQAAQAKLEAKRQLLPGYVAKEHQARLNYTRQKGLFDKGLKPEKEIEYLKEDWDVAVAELASARLDVTAAEQEWEAKKHEREEKQHEGQTKVDYARAMYQDALGQAATQQKEIRDLEIKVSELDRMEILAPRDGEIFRTTVFERGQSVKEGDPLFTIVPDASDRAVELWISGNDTPLVRLGDHVRLQFEGWPAVQFAGWPSVAVGTFGGEVVAIDATDDGTGKFRLLVKPGVGDEWPSRRFLRRACAQTAG